MACVWIFHVRWNTCLLVKLSKYTTWTASQKVRVKLFNNMRALLFIWDHETSPWDLSMRPLHETSLHETSLHETSPTTTWDLSSPDLSYLCLIVYAHKCFIYKKYQIEQSWLNIIFRSSIDIQFLHVYILIWFSVQLRSRQGKFSIYIFDIY